MQKKPQMSKKISRRNFIGSAVAAAFTILPRHVLGGSGQIYQAGVSRRVEFIG